MSSKIGYNDFSDESKLLLTCAGCLIVVGLIPVIFMVLVAIWAMGLIGGGI